MIAKTKSTAALRRKSIRGVAGLITTLAAFALSPNASAQIETPDFGGSLVDRKGADEWTYTLGIGVGAAPDYEGGDDYQAVPIPVARAQKGDRFFSLLGLHMTSNLLSDSNLQLGPSFNYRKGYGDVDNNRVDDLTDRGGSFELGAKLGYTIDLDSNAGVDLGFEVLRDVSSGHDGWLFTPSVQYGRPINQRWNYKVGAKLTYASGSYMSHYFSINSDDSARSGLHEYDADSDFKDAGLHLIMGYKWTKHWNVNLLAQYKRMLGDAKDSPVVDDEGDENQYFAGVTFSYTW